MKINWLEFKEARTFARDLKLKNANEWFKYIKGKSFILKIPHAPQLTYKKEWKDWGDFLGTVNTRFYYVHKRKEFLPFDKAREFVRSLKLKGQKEWVKYIKGKTNILKIPFIPYKIYKKEWKSWGNWVGTSNICGTLRKHKVNDDFFKNWSHDMAYILGFWFADGFISKKRNVFSITQHNKDSYLLKEMLLTMGSDYSLQRDKNSNCLQFTIRSKTIIDDIIKLGGKERKSLDCEMPYVPKKYLPDFVRGEFDGDGCISYSKANKYRASICSASELFATKLLEDLRNNIPNFKGHLSKYVRYREYRPNFKCNKKIFTVYGLIFGANDTRRLRDFMYQNNPKLKMLRKYNKFMEAGKILIATNDRVYWEYEKANKWVKKLNLKNGREWKEYCKSGNKPQNIPVLPYKTYKNRGWNCMSDWLGYNKGKSIAVKE